jgi:undecaprenyl-diphosphatase
MAGFEPRRRGGICAALLEAKDLHHSGGLQGSPLAPLAVGFAVAAVVGYFALRWLLPIVRQGKLYRFAYYCWAVGAVVILWKAAQLLAGR